MPVSSLLLVNKFYHDSGPAGGVGRYLVQEEADLAAAGWEVIPFAMEEPATRPSAWSGHFVRARDYSSPRWGQGAMSDALSLIWNREAAAKLDRLLAEARPQVAHLHNIYHHLSPSILPVLSRRRIPVVMTLHDLRLLCPAIHMLRGGEVCERCRGGRFHNAVLGRCVKGSRAASLLAAIETFHQRSRRLYPRYVDTFLCPSRFILEKYAEWGFPRDKLVHLPNFVDLQAWHPDLVPAGGVRDSYLYFGRISTEKGLKTLLDAQALWEERHRAGRLRTPPLRLLIAGEGPCLENMKARKAQLSLQTVELLGPLDRPALLRTLGRCRFTVLPSECYENSPMAALESLAAGVPLVGTRLGGIPEMVSAGSNGILVGPRDAEGLLEGLLQAADLPPEAGLRARAWAEANASRPEHMAALMKILESAAAGRISRRSS